MVGFKRESGGAAVLKHPPPGAAWPAPLVSRTRAIPVKFLHSHTPLTQVRPIKPAHLHFLLEKRPMVGFKQGGAGELA